MTVTYFTARSNLVPYAFVWEKEKPMDLSETVVVFTPEILDLCDERQDPKKTRGEPEGAKDYREIKRKIRTELKKAKETWIQGTQ